MACACTDGYQTDRQTNTQSVRGGQEEFGFFFQACNPVSMVLVICRSMAALASRLKNKDTFFQNSQFSFKGLYNLYRITTLSISTQPVSHLDIKLV